MVNIVKMSEFKINRRGQLVNAWYKHKTHTGWKKTLPASRRRALLWKTAKSKNVYDRTLEVARRINALANVTTDPMIKKLARADAKFFFAKARAMRAGR